MWFRTSPATAAPPWDGAPRWHLEIEAGRLGYRVELMPVRHRPRTAGRTKFGVWNRALPGLLDCLGVRWMRSRWQPVEYHEIDDKNDEASP